MSISERKKREKEKRRESIIDAAEKVFFSKGFKTSTMDDIAEVSELSKGTLYLYFKSKESLHLQVALRGVNILNRMAAGIQDKKSSAIEKLTELGKTFILFAKQFPGYLNSILYVETIDFGQTGISRDELRELLLSETPVKMVMDLVSLGIQENCIRKDIPGAIIAHTLWSQMLGMFQFVTFQRGLFEMVEMGSDEFFDYHLELVLNGIRS